MNLRELELQPPAMAYQLAFDHCAVEASRNGGPVQLVADKPDVAQEMMWRLPDAILASAHGGQLIDEAKPDAPDRAENIVWLMLNRSAWPGDLDKWTRQVASGTRLIVLGHSGHWRRFLPGAPSDSLNARVVAEELTLLGWHVRQFGFLGLSAILIGATARLPAVLRRDDLIDRWHAAARERFVIRGRRSAWAALWLITAERAEAAAQ